jgi:hypothetical protein
VEYELFHSWHKLSLKEQLLAPVNQFTLDQYQEGLKKKAFKSLYNNRTLRIIKKTMANQAVIYNSEAVKRKALETLIWYTFEHMRMKNKLALIGNLHYKRRYVNRWLQVLNSVSLIKENITDSIRLNTQSSVLKSTHHFIGDF